MNLNNLKYYREKCGLTQQQVADALNINRSTYTYYEKGKTEPSINTLQKIMLLFNIDFDKLYPQDIIKVSEPQAECIAESKILDVSVPQLNSVEKDMLLKIRLLNEEDRMKIMNEINRLCEGIL